MPNQVPSDEKEQLLRLFQQKKIKLKELEDKCELQNKKIKLFRKQNQQLKNVIEQRNQIDTNLLLQSKQLLATNTKLQKSIEQLKQQIQISKKNQELNQNNKINNEQNDKNKQLVNNQSHNNRKRTIINKIVTIKQITISQTTTQIDLPNAQITDHQFLQLQNFNQLKMITVNDSLLQNQSIIMICGKFINLQKLNLANNKFQALALINVKNLINLKALDIRNNNLGDQAIKYISFLEKLEDLSCSKNTITDVGAQYIQNIQNLAYLDITNNQISSKGCQSFSKLEKITHLYLMSNKLSKDGIIDLISNMKKLQYLDVRFNVWTNEEKEAINSFKKESLIILC